jgi:hypothetical protein
MQRGRIMTRFLNLALFGALLASCAVGANAADIIVDSANGPYTTIQAGWDAAVSGDVIKVKPGTNGVYTEALFFDGGDVPPAEPGYADKDNITVMAVDAGGNYAPRTVIIQGPASDTQIQLRCLWGFTLKGFEITGFGVYAGPTGHGVQLYTGAAGYLHNTKDVTLEDLYVHDCTGFLYAADYTTQLDWPSDPGLKQYVFKHGMITVRNVELVYNYLNEDSMPRGILGATSKWTIENVWSYSDGGDIGVQCNAVSPGVPPVLVDPGQVDVTVRDCTVEFSTKGNGYNFSNNALTGDPDVPSGTVVIENCLASVLSDIDLGNGYSINTTGVDYKLRGDQGEYCNHGVFSWYEYDEADYGPTSDFYVLDPVAYGYLNFTPNLGSMTLEALPTRARNVFVDMTGHGVFLTNPVFTLKNTDCSRCEATGVQIGWMDWYSPQAPPLDGYAEDVVTTNNVWVGTEARMVHWGKMTFRNCRSDDNGVDGSTGFGYLLCELGELYVDDCSAARNGAVWSEWGADTSNYRFEHVKHCEVTNCISSHCGADGFVVDGCGVAILRDCTADNSCELRLPEYAATWGGDIACWGAKEFLAENCTSTNSQAAGLQVQNTVLAELRNCTAEGAQLAGIELGRCVLASVDHCAALGCGQDGSSSGIEAYSGSNGDFWVWPPGKQDLYGWVDGEAEGTGGVNAPPGLRAVITNCVSTDTPEGNGVYVEGYHREGEFDSYVDCVLRNAIISDNSAYGISLVQNCDVSISYSDLYSNGGGDHYVGDPMSCTYTEGAGMIGADPMFDVDYSLQAGSPCIGAGDPRDLDVLETRADMGFVDYADDPYPAKLMRETTRARIWEFEMPALGHSEFGIPFTPTGSANPNDMITKNGEPYNVNNRVYMWDSVKKTFLLFPLDFTTLEVGQGYLYLNYFGARADQLDIEYAAVPVPIAGRVLIPEEGRSMIAIPNGQPLWQGDILVKNNGTGEIRTAVEDRAAAEHWLNWNWVFWNFVGSTYDIVGLGNEDEMVQPWYSYQVWAYQRDLTLIFPGG